MDQTLDFSGFDNALLSVAPKRTPVEEAQDKLHLRLHQLDHEGANGEGNFRDATQSPGHLKEIKAYGLDHVRNMDSPMNLHHLAVWGYSIQASTSWMSNYLALPFLFEIMKRIVVNSTQLHSDAKQRSVQKKEVLDAFNTCLSASSTRCTSVKNLTDVYRIRGPPALHAAPKQVEGSYVTGASTPRAHRTGPPWCRHEIARIAQLARRPRHQRSICPATQLTT